MEVFFKQDVVLFITSGYDSPLSFVKSLLQDPVTGSAHCALGPFWARKLGKETLKGFQVMTYFWVNPKI